MRAQHVGKGRLDSTVKWHAKAAKSNTAVLTAAVLLALGMASSAHATDFVVSDASDSGPGTLRQAVLDANAQPGPHTINFSLPPGTTIALISGDIVFTGEDVTILGTGRDALTISGSHASRIFDVQGGNLTIHDLTLRDGLAASDGTNLQDETGGAIRVGRLPPPMTPMQFLALHADAEATNWSAIGETRRPRRALGGTTRKIFTQSKVTGVFAAGLTLDHVSLVDNRADAPLLPAGGAIFASGGATLTIRSSLFSGNSSTYAGGAICAIGGDDLYAGLISAGHFEITDSVFTGNRIDQNGVLQGQGAAFTSYGPGGSISRTVFSNNVINDSPPEEDYSEGKGAALEILMGTLPVTVTDSEISGNTILLRPGSFAEGAGLYCYGDMTPLAIVNSTISGNQSEFGAAIEGRCNLQLINATISGNISSASTTDGSDDAIEMIYQQGVFNATSSLICNPGSSRDLYLYEGIKELGEVSKSLICVPDPSTPPLPPDTIIGVDPMLGPLANNGGPTRTHALLPGSVAINAGENPQGLLFDQRGPGFGRSVGAAEDIGAFELDPDRILTSGFD